MSARIVLLAAMFVALVAAVGSAVDPLPTPPTETAEQNSLAAAVVQHFDEYFFDQPEERAAAVREYCESLKGSPFSFLRCETPEEENRGAETAARFLAAQGLQGTVGDDDMTPVIMLPGIGGSALEATLKDRKNRPHWYCTKNQKKPYRIWLRADEVLVQDCLFANLALEWDAKTDTYSDTQGVTITPVDIGGVDGVDYMARQFGMNVKLSSVYSHIISAFKAVGYTPGKNLRGLPYDFRRHAPQLDKEQGWSKMVRELVEETAALNGGKKVMLIAHSMGGPTANYFLTQMTEEWRAQYIEQFVPIAAPFGGAASALRTVLSGQSFGLPEFLLKPKRLRDVSRTYPGLIWLLPQRGYYADDHVFVSLGDQEYTASDLEQLFRDVGLNETAEIYNIVGAIVDEMAPPQVDTHCIYGYNVPTEIALHYPSVEKFMDQPVIDYSDQGDGTVPLNSLKHCDVFGELQPQPVATTKFNLHDHSEVLTSPEVISLLLKLATGKK